MEKTPSEHDSRKAFAALPEPERVLRLLAARIAHGARDSESLALLCASRPLHVTAVHTGCVSWFVIAVEGFGPPWFLHAWFVDGEVQDVLCHVCAEDDRGGYCYRARTTRRRFGRGRDSRVRGVVQRFLDARGLVRWASEQNWLVD